MRFGIIADDPLSKARVGLLETFSGKVSTPAFMAVGTQATVKTMDTRDITESGCDMILANAYHLSIRPGEKLIHEQGGLHEFMKWNGPILTDSGGYQLFSLSSLAKVFDDGIRFRNHLDGSEIFLTPRKVIEMRGYLCISIDRGFTSDRYLVDLWSMHGLHRVDRWSIKGSDRSHMAVSVLFWY